MGRGEPEVGLTASSLDRLEAYGHVRLCATVESLRIDAVEQLHDSREIG